MRNEAGDSRGFGFVSFQTPDQAAAAMHAMNGVVLEKKTVIVRLHEPKQLRQEKLAARFSGHNGHPRSASGATSPTLSEGGDSYVGWPSPSSHPAVLGSPTSSLVDRTPERQRRGSGSYYQVSLVLLPLFLELTYTSGCVIWKLECSTSIRQLICFVSGRS
jgi:polyadenylate-binding protein